MARALHGMTQGTTSAFCRLRQAAIEDALVEYESGARTVYDVVRLMQGSVRGTLFLDGISEMSLEAQGRLLRVLTQYESAQNRVDASQRMDLRIIASTSEDLRILVSTGRFRQELYQRLATVEIALPPLRERMEDLPELASHFLERFARLYRREVREIAEEAMERMQEYRWPGNVSELENVMRNGVVQCEGEVFQSHHLPTFAETNRPEQAITTGQQKRATAGRGGTACAAGAEGLRGKQASCGRDARHQPVDSLSNARDGCLGGDLAVKPGDHCRFCSSVGTCGFATPVTVD